LKKRVRAPAESAYARPPSLPDHENRRETETQNAATRRKLRGQSDAVKNGGRALTSHPVIVRNNIVDVNDEIYECRKQIDLADKGRRRQVSVLTYVAAKERGAASA
jgi:hypothetical protein